MKTTTTCPKISQSGLKLFEKKHSCLYYWQKKYVEHVVTEKPTYPMLRGLLFEQLCIGAGSGRSEAVVDLPRLKDGKKSAEHLRIEKQAENFKTWIKENNFYIIPETIQMKIETDDTEGVLDFMLVDVDGRIGKAGETFQADLKFTGDIFEEFGFTNWNKLNTIDFTQQISYTRIWYKEQKQLLRSLLYVADCSTSMNTKVILINIDPKNFADIEDRFKNLYDYVNAYFSEGYDLPANPSNRNCNTCPFADRCQFKVTGPVFEEVSI